MIEGGRRISGTGLKRLWEFISTALVAAAAVVMLVVFLQDRSGGASDPGSAQAFVPDWREWAQSGIRVGSEEATMVIAVFVDFTCPYCAALAPVFDSLRAELGNVVAIEFHHFPLFGREFSTASGIAAECADRQGRFEEMYHALFSLGDSLGLREWSAVATDVGVQDIPAFQRCVKLPRDGFTRLARGRALGARVGVKGTPTVWINGHLFNGRTIGAFRQRAKSLGLL